MHPQLESFQSVCTEIVARDSGPSETVRALAPEMNELLRAAPEFLEPCHRRGRPDQYARNLVFGGDNDSPSLFTLVWAPGQWTPIHDHGTWGVVGVVEGVLEEQSYVRVDDAAESDGDEGIELLPGGLVLLPPGAVATFVPNPDHIHVTGVAASRKPTLSIHLYGRYLNAFHVYDKLEGTRKLVEVDHAELAQVSAPLGAERLKTGQRARVHA